jgi:2-polyprenyl-3-methyl-5-hydroxy-6-metoxy-1,4-benzoquinol methylase
VTDSSNEIRRIRMSDWYIDDEFWRRFGPLMFSEPQFSEAAEQVPRILERLDLKNGRVLDLGCGPGRHALPLARAGLAVTAVDTSAYLLGGLQTRADIEGVVGGSRAGRHAGLRATGDL